jgi:hypothetical protein
MLTVELEAYLASCCSIINNIMLVTIAAKTGLLFVHHPVSSAILGRGEMNDSRISK